MKVPYFLSSIRAAVVCLMLVFCTNPCFASPAGAIDFADLSAFYGEPKVEINLSKALIGMVGLFAQEEDPEVAAMLNKIESIKVRVYNLNSEPKKALETINKITTAVKSSGWEPLVSVNEKGSRVRILSRVSDNKMDGLVVMVVDESAQGEAVFINIVGEIDPAQITKVTKRLNLEIPSAP